jgi:hypothetical protein
MQNHAYRPSFSFAESMVGSASMGRECHLGRKTPQRRRGSDSDPDPGDGNSSLTYSVASSVTSTGSSSTGECTTDSSFGDIMRVLDTEDTPEMKGFIRNNGVNSDSERRNQKVASGQSVASSSAYSTDGESLLEGTKLLQAIHG